MICGSKKDFQCILTRVLHAGGMCAIRKRHTHNTQKMRVVLARYVKHAKRAKRKAHFTADFELTVDMFR